MSDHAPVTDRHALVNLPRPVGFVLSGGASLGSVQVGMLQALEAAGVRPDFLVGSSVGALNASILAADPQGGLAKLTHMWLELQRSDVFPGNLLGSIWRLGRTRTHALGTEGLERIAERILDAESFTDLETPLGVVAVDLTAGEVRLIETGALVPALLASSAIPGVFPSVVIDGHVHVDGAMLADLGIDQAMEFGSPGSLVLLDCQVPPPPRPLHSVTDILGATTKLQFRERLRHGLSAAVEQIPVISMPAPGAHRTSPFDFDLTETLIDEARAAGTAFLDELDLQGAGLYGDPLARYRVAERPVDRGAEESAALVQPAG